MKNFTYYQPTTVEQAVGLLADKWGPAELLAGGTDLHDLQKEYVAQPEAVVSLNILGGGFRQVRSTRSDPPTITIGAGVRLADIADDPTVRRYAVALATAAGMVG